MYVDFFWKNLLRTPKESPDRVFFSPIRSVVVYSERWSFTFLPVVLPHPVFVVISFAQFWSSSFLVVLLGHPVLNSDIFCPSWNDVPVSFRRSRSVSSIVLVVLTEIWPSPQWHTLWLVLIASSSQTFPFLKAWKFSKTFRLYNSNLFIMNRYYFIIVTKKWILLWIVKTRPKDKNYIWITHNKAELFLKIAS